MLYKVQYSSEVDRQAIINENTDKTLIEEQNIFDGNFLIFSDQKIAGTDLQVVQQAKIAQMQDLYYQELTAGFTSSATGSSHQFDYGESDQKKFMKLALDINDGITTFPVPIPDKESSIVMHDQSQYQQLRRDISAFEWGLQTKLHTKIGQVKTATTVEEANAVVW